MLGRRKNRRRPPSERQWRVPVVRLRGLMFSMLSLSALAAAVGLVVSALDQPIESVSVEGRFERVSLMDVKRAVSQSVHGTGLVSVDLAGLRAVVKRLPWIDAVSIERNWPRGLNVHIVEQVAAARWGKDGLLNTRGELFASGARHIPLELPQLVGPDGSETEVAQRYLAIHGRLLEAGMRLTALRLDARGAWEFDLANGVTVRLGRKRVDERFETFMATASKIVVQRATDIAYIDMRYTNGFAISWRNGSAHATTSERGMRDV